MNKKIFFLLLIISIIIFNSTIAFAQATSPIQQIIDTIGGKDFGKLYTDYQTFIDFVIFLIFFIGISLVSLGRLEQFKTRGGKAVIIAIGLALTFGLTWWAQDKDIKIIPAMGPFAAILFVLVIMYAIYKILSDFFKAETAISKAEIFLISFAIAWYILTFILPQATEIILNLPGLGAIVALIAGVGLIVLIWKVIQKAISAFSGGGGPSTAGVREVEEKTKKEKKEEAKEIYELSLICKILKKMKNVIGKDPNAFKECVEELNGANALLNKFELEEESEEEVRRRLGIRDKKIKDLLGEEIGLKNAYFNLLKQIDFNNPEHSKKIIDAVWSIARKWIRINRRQYRRLK